jgi:hypothetical protein
MALLVNPSNFGLLCSPLSQGPILSYLRPGLFSRYPSARPDGGVGVSCVDPDAEVPTSNNQWVVEGPHTMVIVPDPAQLEGLFTGPNNGGTYVIWKGTPYLHIMVPLGKRPANKP